MVSDISKQPYKAEECISLPNRYSRSRSSARKLVSASIAAFAASTILSGPVFAGEIAPGNMVTVGMGDPIEAWTVQNDAELNVSTGGHILTTSVFSVLNMNGGVASMSTGASGYTITGWGGNLNIANSSISGNGGLGLSSFFDAPTSAVVTNSTIEGLSQAVLVQHNSSLQIDDSMIRGGSHGFEIINGGQVKINRSDITSGGVGIVASAGSMPDAVGSTVVVRDSDINSVGTGVQVLGNSRADLIDTTIETTGDGAPGIDAQSGSVINATRVDITTSGANSQGVRIDGVGTTVNYVGGSVRTSGQFSSGFELGNGATANIDGTLIEVNGADADGIKANAGGTVNAQNVTINASHDNTHGIWANAGVVDLSNSTINTTGIYGVGLFVSNDGLIDATNVTINTEGERAYGANLGTGILNMDRSRITTAGRGAVGIRNTGGSVSLSNTIVETGGYGADGINASGGTTDLRFTSITTLADEAYGARVAGGAEVSITGSEIHTAGKNSYGVAASGTGSRASLDQALIETTGESAHAVFALDGAAISIKSSALQTTGDGGVGLRAKNATASMAGGSISTSGVLSHGVLVSDGATVDIGRDPISGAGTLIHTTGDKSAGINAQTGSTVNVDGATIRTEGGGEGAFWAVGVLASGDSTVNMVNTAIETAGNRGAGINAQEDGTHVEMSGGSITTTGANGDGAVAFTGATASLTDVVVSTANGRGVVAGDVGSWLTMTGGSVTTKGNGTDNSAAFAVRGASVDLTGVDVRTEGDDARGLHAFNEGSIVSAKGSRVTTFGTGSHGGFASSGGSVNVTDSFIKTQGAGANGLVAQNGSSVVATGSAIQTAGADSTGVYLANDSSAALDGSLVVATSGPALKNGGGDVAFDLKNGTQAIGVSGTLLDAAAGSSTTLKADNNVVLSGDIIAQAADTVIDASLSNNSFWQGAAKGVTSTSVDSTSRWLMIGSSDVGTLTNDGVIEFDSANPYKTLTTGSLVMDGGSFILNTKLNEGGLSSETDKVVVEGDASGNGLIHIRNNGGAGAFTGTGPTDGIQVVEIDGASDADFKLGSAAVVGIYDYHLNKADGQNWYLQTEGTEPDTGHVVDIVPGYNIALSAAQNHVLTTLDTFHERVGELRSDELQDGFNAWTRGIGKTGSYAPKSITGYNGSGFDLTTGGLQIGGDYSTSGVFIAGDKLTFGIFGELAHSKFDVDGRTAHGSISSKGIGGYVTWQQQAPTDRKPGTGAYVDAVVKHDWLDFGVGARSVSGFDLQNGYEGKATTASIETGYGFDLGNNVVLQPQAQLTWSTVKADSFTDPYGIAVHGQEAESLIGRIGLRLEKTFYLEDEDAVTPSPAARLRKKGTNTPAAAPDTAKSKKFVKTVTTFVDANARHEFKGKNGLVASDTAIGSDMSGTRFDVGAGVVARVSENVSLYARGAIEIGGSTNVAGKVTGGLKITW